MPERVRVRSAQHAAWGRPHRRAISGTGAPASCAGDGAIGWHMRVESNRHVLHFDALAVAPSAPNRGVGNMLVAGPLKEARHRGARKLGLRD
jgi:GNAT superfamily N-acetyltransferase